MKSNREKVEIKIIKEVAGMKKGEVRNVTKTIAKQMVDNGTAEYKEKKTASKTKNKTASK